ncbi:glycosyltransferase [Sphingomonas sp. MAH-20]|uniref:Glycosyltransferase n=1 Tax=Sphingomonas horti TaxID=2682842 RepID=A0A6I4IX43_9SPHN|nr:MULTISPECIES: glycosyltransferase [Sphingomonas]MBA2920500.1 glycosyltransferase [Sphingomonas sp. CGMCC 1.13658]MVO76752.1 glycosyltransferase [Sphingomonas horti]
MRILVPLHSFEPGGVERVALRLAAAWAPAGSQPHIVLGRSDGIARSAAPPLAYDVLERGAISTAAFETLWMIARLPGRIRATRPDVLFCAGNSYAVVGAVVKLLLGRRCPPIVLKVSNDLARADLHPLVRPFYRQWLRLQGRLIDRFVGLAEPMRDEIARAMRVAPDRIAIVDNPVLSRAELDRLAAQRDAIERSGAGRRFLAVGRLVPQKRFDLLLGAFARIGRAGDRLAILGDGPERARLETLAQTLGIWDRVDLPGHVEPVGPWLVGSDCFVLSSDYEGVPAVLVEALAAAVPIVTTDCGVSIRSLLDDGRLGSIVPVRDEAALAAAMDAAPAARPAEARARAARFTVERGAAEYLGLFRAVTLAASQPMCGSAEPAASLARQQ